MSMTGLTHTITVQRFDLTVSAEGEPAETLTTIGTFQGYLHEYGSMELAAAATLGSALTGHCLIPYGVDVKEQDRLTAVFADGSSRTVRVVEVRDNHIMLRADVSRDVV